MEWVKEKKIKTPKGEPIEFHDHAFLWDYLVDEAPRIVVQKCTQIGISFTSLIKIIFRGDQDPLSVIYTLPTSGDVKDFVLSKFDPLINSSVSLRSKVTRDPLTRRAVFSTVLKRIGNTHYFFRGSWASHRAQTIDADILVVDELDFQKEDVRTMYEERLSGSSSKDIIYWMGVPTLPHYGISELYEDSDQREWFIECPFCKRRQTLSFPESISFKKISYVCKYCRKNLSDDVRRKGIWIAKNPEKEIHGYAFNRLMAPWISAKKIINDYHNQRPKHFTNFTLGLPYLEKHQQFRKEEFQEAYMDLTEFKSFEKNKIIMGIDQGNNFHTITGFGNTKKGVVTKVKMFRETKDLEKALEVYRPDLIVMDRFPDQHYAKKLQDKFGGTGKFWLVNQRTWMNPSKFHEFMELRKPEGIVSLERTEALDRMYDKIRNGGLRFLSSMSELEDFYDHLKNLVPDLQEKFGKRKKVYKKIGQEDFAHALDYFSVGLDILFPSLFKRPVKIVPSATLHVPLKGTKDWLDDDFERAIRGSARTGDTIIIPRKKF